MLDAKQAEVNTIGGAGEVVKLKFSDINPYAGKDKTEDHGDFTIEYPYEVTVTDDKGKVILKEKTQGTLKAKDWSKKFYVKESANGNEYVAYTRYMSLLALITIKKQLTGELPAKINLNDMVGFEFDAVVIALKDQDPFIDWVGTFDANGVQTPTVDELRGHSSSFDSEPKKPVDIKEARESMNNASKKGAW